VTTAVLAPPSDSGFGAASPAQSNEFVLVLIRAMIGAAKADGHIDDAERALIFDKIKAADISGEAAAFIERELSQPTDLDALIAAAVTEEQRVELYTASRLTIDPDSRSERGYLDLLAGRLGLPDERAGCLSQAAGLRPSLHREECSAWQIRNPKAVRRPLPRPSFSSAPVSSFTSCL
jgi:uncharacterized membrane protein YebE (DUF533 family)